MQITEIVVSAGRTFNHPYESYSNLRPQVTLKATLQEGENADQAAKALQAKAEHLVEDHKRILLADLQEAEQMSRRDQEIRNLESRIADAQDRLTRLRADPGAKPMLTTDFTAQPPDGDELQPRIRHRDAFGM